MSMRSQLVYLPGFPYTPATLMPKHALAAVAAVLRAEGHETQVWDGGTLEGFRALVPPELRCGLQDLRQRPSRASARDLRRGLIAAHQKRAEMVACRLLESRVDWFLIYIQHHRDLAIASHLAAELRRRSPQLPILAAGSFVARLAESLLDLHSPFSAICHTSDLEPTAAGFARALATGEDWSSVPGLTWRRSGSIQHTAEAGIDEFPLPPVACFGKEVYPEAVGSGNFHLATVEDTRGCSTLAYASPQRRGWGGLLRVKPAAVVVEEILASCLALRTRVCHFAGYGAESVHLQSLARRIATLDLDLVYSRRLHPQHVAPADMEILAESGCRLAGLRLDTGSQRLLEDYYGHRFTVSRFESLLHAARRHGIAAAVEVTYPSPADDWHTREETLRILRRTQPAAVRVSWPQVWPSALWHEQAANFGFATSPATYRKWIDSWPLAEDHTVDWSARPLGLARLRAGAPSQAPLADALRADGVPLGLSETELLIGHMLDSTAPVAQALALREATVKADMDGLAEMIGRFNDAAAPVMAQRRLQQFVPMQVAVGN